jgi:hypothetical protein
MLDQLEVESLMPREYKYLSDWLLNLGYEASAGYSHGK